VPPAHALEHGVVAGLQRDVQMRRNVLGLAHCGNQGIAQMVDLDGREAQPLDARDSTDLPDEVREVVARRAVPGAAEVDPGQDDLAVSLCSAPTDLGEHGSDGPAARSAPSLGDDTEGAREAAAILDLHEGADAVEAALGLHAPERADGAGNIACGLFAPQADDLDVLGQPLQAALAVL